MPPPGDAGRGFGSVGPVTFDHAHATPQSVEAETDRALAEADAIVAAATEPGAARSVAATLLPLDHARGVVGEAMGSAGFMAYVHPDPDVRAAGHVANERLERWAVDVAVRSPGGRRDHRARRHRRGRGPDG